MYFGDRLSREVRESQIRDVFFIGFLLRLTYWPWNVRIIGAVLVLAGLFAIVKSTGAIPT